MPVALLCAAAVLAAGVRGKGDYGDPSLNDDLSWQEKDEKTTDPRTARDTYFDKGPQEVTLVLHDLVDGLLYPRKQFNMWNTMGHGLHCRDTLVEEQFPQLHDQHCIDMLAKAYERMDSYPDIPYRVCKTIFGLKPPGQGPVRLIFGNATVENNYQTMADYFAQTGNRLYGRDLRWMTRVLADMHLLREERLWHDGQASIPELVFHAESDWDDVMADQAIFALKCAEHEDLNVYGTVLDDTRAVP